MLYEPARPLRQNPDSPVAPPVIESGDRFAEPVTLQVDAHGPGPCAATGERLSFGAGDQAPVCPDCGWAVRFHSVA